MIKAAIAALEIPDPERLDTYSLRRSAVAYLDRTVGEEIGRKVPGHRTGTMWRHYQPNAVGDDVHGATAGLLVLYKGAVQDPPTNPPTESISLGGNQRRNPRNCGGFKLVRRLELLASSLRIQPETAQSACPQGVSDRDNGEEKSRKSRHDGAFNLQVQGGSDPRLATLSRWADECPQAMLWLLRDPILRELLAKSLGQVLSAQEPPGLGRGIG